jgi:cathepsin H
MSFFVLVASVFSLTTALHPKLAANPVDNSQEVFRLWQKEFDVKYASHGEEAHRYLVWRSNVDGINRHNNEETHSWTQGINAFTGTTWEEFSEEILMDPQDCSATEHHNPKLKAMPPPPPHVDWRDQMMVSEVKNQGSCGSCWSFSTTGCLESHHAIASHRMTLYSEQNLVDCAWNFNNFGCDGGLPSQAFEYIRYNGGIDSEFSYPYTAGHTHTNGTCSYSSSAGATGGRIFDVYNVSQYDEQDLFLQVGTMGPVSICFDVVSGFSAYTGGVYESTVCGNTSQSVNHAVLAVGYDVNHDPVNGDTPFWWVKNSWGWNWGLNGYFKIVRDKNMCGLASCASFPIVDPGLLA